MKRILFTLIALAMAIPVFSQTREEKKLDDGTPYTLVTDANRLRGVEVNGKLIIPCQYQYISALGDVYQCEVEDAKFYFDSNGNQLFSLTKDHWVRPLTNKDKKTMFLVDDVSGKAGVLDLHGHMVLPYNYTYISLQQTPDGDFFEVSKHDNYQGAYTTNGEEVIPCQYDMVHYWNGYFAIQKDAYAGMCDPKGKVIVPADTYDHVTYLNHSIPYFLVGKGMYKGILDTQGKVLLPANRYNYASLMINGEFTVGLGDKGGICDASGNEKFISDEYTNIYYTERTGLPAYCYKKGQAGYVLKDFQGNVIEEEKPTVKRETKTDGGFTYVAVTDVTGLEGIETTSGKTLIPAKYSRIFYSDGTFSVYSEGGGYGLYDSKGKVLIEANRGYTLPITNLQKYYLVEKGNYSGIADLNGNEVIAPDRYQSIRQLDNGMFLVKKGNLYGVINKSGKEIMPVKYHKCDLYYDGHHYETQMNGLHGICDLQGREILPPQFTDISFSEKDKYHPFDTYYVKNGQKCGMYKSNGEILFPVSAYEYVDYDTFHAEDYGYDFLIEARDKTVGGTKVFFDLNLNPVNESTKEAEKRRNELWEQAEEAFHAGKYSTACELYEQAGNIRWEADLAYNVSVCHYKLKNYSKAVEAADRCIQLGPSDTTRVDAYNLKGKCQNYATGVSGGSSKSYSDRDMLVDIAKSAYKLYRDYRKFRKTF